MAVLLSFHQSKMFEWDNGALLFLCSYTSFYIRDWSPPLLLPKHPALVRQDMSWWIITCWCLSLHHRSPSKGSREARHCSVCLRLQQTLATLQWQRAFHAGDGEREKRQWGRRKDKPVEECFCSDPQDYSMWWKKEIWLFFCSKNILEVQSVFSGGGWAN